MASCITPQWGNNYSPQVRLTVSQQSSNDTQVVLAWTLEYVAHGYAVSTSNTKAYTAVIAGETVASGSYAIGGKTGTSTIASGTKTINKTTSSQNITFSCSMTFNVTWNGVYGGEKSASNSITVGAKTSYTVSYNANGGSGAPSSQTKWYGTNITLSSTKPTHTGYTFEGWGTSSSDTTVDYAAGATYSANASITLYAIWKAITYTVFYNANGGSGAPGNQTKTYDVNLTLSNTKPTRTNYNFKGWGTSSSATTVSYNAGGTYTQNANITLYAIWELAYTKPRITNVSVQRCISDGTINEEGTYLKFIFSWATDKTVSAIGTQWRTAGSSSWNNYKTISASGTSGNISWISEDGWSIETSYEVRIYVTDSDGTTYTPSISIGTAKFPIDVKAGGTGIAFGKVAENDIFEVAFNAKFNNNLTLKGVELSTLIVASAREPSQSTGSLWLKIV